MSVSLCHLVRSHPVLQKLTEQSDFYTRKSGVAVFVQTCLKSIINFTLEKHKYCCGLSAVENVTLHDLC